jgi:RNA polymerase sigma-70 factor (ECF subfamily)
VYRWALSRTADPDDADDVTQEVLMRLEQTVGTYRGDSRFTTWLYRLTGNVAIDFQRGQTRRARLVERQSANSPDAVWGDRLSEIHTSDVTRLVRIFFHKLPDRQREVFDLVDLQGFTPAEVGRMIDMKGTTVRAHLFKARRAIRRQIIREVPTLAEEFSE